MQPGFGAERHWVSSFPVPGSVTLNSSRSFKVGQEIKWRGHVEAAWPMAGLLGAGVVDGLQDRELTHAPSLRWARWMHAASPRHLSCLQMPEPRLCPNPSPACPDRGRVLWVPAAPRDGSVWGRNRPRWAGPPGGLSCLLATQGQLPRNLHGPCPLGGLRGVRERKVASPSRAPQHSRGPWCCPLIHP